MLLLRSYCCCRCAHNAAAFILLLHAYCCHSALTAAAQVIKAQMKLSQIYTGDFSTALMYYPVAGEGELPEGETLLSALAKHQVQVEHVHALALVGKTILHTIFAAVFCTQYCVNDSPHNIVYGSSVLLHNYTPYCAA